MLFGLAICKRLVETKGAVLESGMSLGDAEALAGALRKVGAFTKVRLSSRQVSREQFRKYGIKLFAVGGPPERFKSLLKPEEYKRLEAFAKRKGPDTELFRNGKFPMLREKMTRKEVTELLGILRKLGAKAQLIREP